MSEASKDFPFADTAAARMFSAGLHRLHREQRISQRKLAKQLGYRQSTVLSHMASGRVGIPIERASELARALELDERLFLLAVLRQRHPDTNWAPLTQGDWSDSGETTLVTRLESIAQRPLDQFTPGQLMVMREVAGAPDAERRWLTVHELELVERLRKIRPAMGTEGISDRELNCITACIRSHTMCIE